ncbi:cytochrome P450 [Streptomyces silaceus]|uniref:cytochrome P450 n=1 Tax=Streptomyces silaceus TaxID=545123 RepID=UPI0007C6894E|nr:cytochrome P450 [Streptomyces silaceus]
MPTPLAPGALPLIGHGLRLAQRPLQFMDSLREHGPVVRIQLARTPAYVVTDPALTKEVLVTGAADYAKGGRIIDALRVFFGDGLATVADGDTHMKNRRLMQPMFNRAHIATRGDAMIEQVREIVDSWPEDEPRDTLADMTELTLAAFLGALFGTDLPAHLQDDFLALMPPIMRGTIRQTLLPGWVNRLPLPANRAHAERVARLRRLIDQAIDHRTAALDAQKSAPAKGSADAVGEGEVPAAAAQCPHVGTTGTTGAGTGTPDTGLFDTLLTAPEPLSRRQLQDEAITLLTGAIETTSTTLAWALYEIDKNPEIRHRLQEELKTVCGGDGPLRHEHLDQLTYTRAVLQESMRQYGPAWLVTRTATRTLTLGGHRIPEGADVVYSPYLHQHDPAVFPHPARFDPDRWSERPDAATRGSFLAFGAGRRNCIGEAFAWTELLIVLATITRSRPGLTLAPGSSAPRPQAVVTVKPDNLMMVPRR